MKVGVSYKQQPVSEKFDAIVIGSGMGGLTTAALLAKDGKKVLVLEKHYTAGGFTHAFKRKNYEWDVGIHYIGAVNKKTRTLRRLFDYVTDSKLEWADMGEVYDRAIFGEKEYRFVKGVDNFKRQMKEYFPAPKDQASIDAYVDLVKKANAVSRNYFAEKAMPPLVSKFTGYFMRSPYMKFADKTTLEVMRSITDNKQLIGVLTAQYGDYGMPPALSSFAIHAMVVSHYFDGGYYPVGGAGRIAETIEPVIKAAGGKIYINADVSEVIVKGNKAIGVKMADGKELYADTIISNAGIINTYRKLIPAEIGKHYGMADLVKKVTPSAAHVSLYIGLQHTAKDLNLPKANYWIYPDNYDHDENLQNYLDNPDAPLPVTYISFPAAKDPEFEKYYPGRSTIEIIGFMPYERFAKWEGTQWNHRGEEYEAFKEKLSQKLLEQLYRFEPQVKGKIDVYEMSTPLSTANFVNYARGEIYGINHTPDRFALKFLRPATPVKNLYLTGQDIATCGVAGALMSGLLTASAILKRNVSDDIFKAKG
ncbi:MAG: NAD(P)/FAD-dependent oxidoreductase [Chitinophagales bacterium]|nr:NAD(P)/FAD-dependent oxidoreductase [Chitinophagales bacterium]